MNVKTLSNYFLFSIITLPVIFGVLAALNATTTLTPLTLVLFIATILVEVVALTQLVWARRTFAAGDPGYLTWTLIVTFMIVRLIGEARLLSLNVGIVPQYQEGSSVLLFVYIIVFRYLYTVSDILFIAALFTTIRSYKSTGLPFNLVAPDYFYIAAMWMLPIITYIFRANLIESSVSGNGGYIATYRLVAVTVGAAIATLCIVVRRYALQMGGGAVAQVWNVVVIAGVVRDGSFLALALISIWSKAAAGFVEQYLLWIFAGCWLLAGLYQKAVFTRTTKSHRVYVAKSAA
jgi:hypothetical protein